MPSTESMVSSTFSQRHLFTNHTTLSFWRLGLTMSAIACPNRWLWKHHDQRKPASSTIPNQDRVAWNKRLSYYRLSSPIYWPLYSSLHHICILDLLVLIGWITWVTHGLGNHDCTTPTKPLTQKWKFLRFHQLFPGIRPVRCMIHLLWCYRFKAACRIRKTH